jgi:Polyketide cyclase / dehydrase and lipid transport
MLLRIVLALLAAIVILVGFAATKPDGFRVDRSTRIAASPEKIFALVGDLKGFNRWNPWEKKDPGKGTYGAGSTSGPGASYAWESDKLGAGRMTIVEAVPSSMVKLRLDFIKPMQATNSAVFEIVPEGDITRVTWSMSGQSNLIAKVVQIFVSMDRMVGDDFAAGLAGLKALAEAP